MADALDAGAPLPAREACGHRRSCGDTHRPPHTVRRGYTILPPLHVQYQHIRNASVLARVHVTDTAAPYSVPLPKYLITPSTGAWNCHHAEHVTPSVN